MKVYLRVQNEALNNTSGLKLNGGRERREELEMKQCLWQEANVYRRI